MLRWSCDMLLKSRMLQMFERCDYRIETQRSLALAPLASVDIVAGVGGGIKTTGDGVLT